MPSPLLTIDTKTKPESTPGGKDFIKQQVEITREARLDWEPIGDPIEYTSHQVGRSLPQSKPDKQPAAFQSEPDHQPSLQIALSKHHLCNPRLYPREVRKITPRDHHF